MANDSKRLFVCLLTLFSGSLHVSGAELVALTAQNWDQYAPRGKEVDCICGDLVLRNDRVTAVVAHPVAGRNANYRVREVGGGLIDLTVNGEQSDQLTAYYPGGGKYALRFAEARADIGTSSRTSVTQTATNLTLSGEAVELVCQPVSAVGSPSLVVTYRLKDNEPFLLVTSSYRNDLDKPLEVELIDRVCADRTFEYGRESATNLAWWYDRWFGQAYGIVAEQRTVEQGPPERKVGSMVRYSDNGKSAVMLEPGESIALARRIFPGKNLIDVRANANQLTGVTNHPVSLNVQDSDGPVPAAEVKLTLEDQSYASGRTDKNGHLKFAIPPGTYAISVESPARGSQTLEIDSPVEQTITVELPNAGYVAGRITDTGGRPIACKVQFRGAEETSDPDFGPDSGDHAVKNLYYTANGSFRQEIAPGTYEIIVSHGPEYDAVYDRIEVVRGQTVLLEATMERTVDTSGWVSTDFHGHSSPSGDNTASQFGRVLNLLAEHLEFAPCTEHNRLSSYTPHLQRLGAEHLLATCVGIELTGSPGRVNHQNAFPLIRKPRTQDGGGPAAHEDPVVQIERLALWDADSDKLVQGNHPNIAQILGDRDLDGEADRGFEPMLGYMDVIEVHPPGEIFNPAEPINANRIFHWLQLINLGYRVPGVVNTDAHYNFHGSGWLRNYVQSPTDDPALIRTMDIVHAAERGNVIMTNGPFLEVKLTADGQTVTAGDEIQAIKRSATLAVRVQCPNWFDVDRVQLFLNGRPVEKYNFRRRVRPKMFSTNVIRFEQQISLNFEEDTHVIVVAIGEHSSLGPVMGPDHEQDRPVAVSNPIFVDIVGDGFEPNGDLLGVDIPRLPAQVPEDRD
ncbi:MAG: CehA/McbA family metallohydrolase [Pirellulaceae bacterium]|nr:CehA/McbA family metallohydrolase [Pirellulaceae bacterium]